MHEGKPFEELLKEAVQEPGRMAACYSVFHNYSVGNQLLAWGQLTDRNIPVGPIATLKKWNGLGRRVKGGEKAIILCMPVTRKREDEDGDVRVWTQFVFRAFWFAVAQTEGPDVEPEPIPEWDYLRALEKLAIEEVPFTMMDGNCQGYAHPDKRTIAINPVADHAWRTRIHEMAHVLLHDTDCVDDGVLLTNERELEAESVSYIVGACLGLPGAEESRGYIQHWYASKTVPEKIAQRIFKAADKILKSGKQEDKSE